MNKREQIINVNLSLFSLFEYVNELLNNCQVIIAQYQYKEQQEATL
jgi:hypothetical protein